jgi:hypothetical protein
MSYIDVMMFDPRLLEYIEKKKYYIKNNITPCMPLETEYAISSNDIIKIKRYLQKNVPQHPISLPGETKKKYVVYPPEIQYKSKLHYDKLEEKGNFEKLNHNPKFDKIINYAVEKTQIPVFLSQIIHKNKSNRVYDDSAPNECVNKIREQYHSGQQLDPEIMTDLMLGVPSHTKKSYGFNDAFEHSFDYIDNDIQEPNHVVLPFPRGGISARLENKKQTKRDILQ